MTLIDAVRTNNVEQVKQLLEQGADPNETDDGDNVTPLHFAASHRAIDVIPLLVKAGANLTARDFDGLMPVDYARNYGYKDVADLLLRLQDGI